MKILKKITHEVNRSLKEDQKRKEHDLSSFYHEISHIKKDLGAHLSRDILLYKEGDYSHLSPERIQLIENITNTQMLSHEALEKKLPSNEEFFFLSFLDRNKNLSQEDIYRARKHFNLQQKDISKLEKKNLLSTKSNYNERPSFVSKRLKEGISFPYHKEVNDSYVLIEKKYGKSENLTPSEQARYLELKKRGIGLKRTSIPSMKEVFFLDSLSDRKKPLSKETFKVISEEWDLEEKDVKSLFTKNYLELDHKKRVIVPQKVKLPEILRDTYAYLHKEKPKHQMPKELQGFYKENSDELIKNRDLKLKKSYYPETEKATGHSLNKIAQEISKNTKYQRASLKELYQLARRSLSYIHQKGPKPLNMSPDHYLLTRYRGERTLDKVLTLLPEKVDSTKKKRPIKLQAKDYGLFFKSLSGNDLSHFEKRRLDKLKAIGIDTSSKEFIQHINEDPTAFPLKKELKKARLTYYKETYKVNLQALKTLNTFKQMNGHQLEEIGLSKSDLERYTKGLKDPYLAQNKLLNKHLFQTPKGVETYYSIRHTGQVSGRAFLEEDIPKKDIARKPQQRQDLLYHDLRVVDAYLEVKKELEKKGYTIKSIHNESSQYSKAKKKVLNGDRSEGPSFMDLELEVLSPSSGSTLTVAIEYGNYTNQRMASKLEHSAYDLAYVYSNKTHQKQYLRNIKTQREVHFRSL